MLQLKQAENTTFFVIEQNNTKWIKSEKQLTFIITDVKGNQKVIKSNQRKTAKRLENTGL